MEIKMWYKKTM